MLKIHKILHPTDFSRCSEQALLHALFLARRHEAELHLLHALVFHSDKPNDPEHRFPQADEILKKLFTIADDKMQSLVSSAEKKSVTIREFRERSFSASAAILDHAKDQQIDLIVMGTHGYRSGPFLGSIAEAVVRNARCPVLTLRESKEPPSIDKVERILVPVDFSDHSPAAVAYGRELAAIYGGRLQLLHCIEVPDWPALYGSTGVWAVPETQVRWRQNSEKALAALMEKPGLPSVEFDTYVLEGRPMTLIPEFVEEYGSDLVVIPTHGTTGLERLLVGSTAERVVRSAKCPVFTVRSFGRSLLGTSVAA